MDLSLLTKYLGEVDERQPPTAIQELPVLPIPNLVLTPGTVLPLHVLHESSLKMIHEALNQHRDLVVCFAPLGRDRTMMMSSVCGAGRVVVIDAFQDGRRNVIVEGDYRVEILHIVQDAPYLKARVRWLPDIEYSDPNEIKKNHASFLNLVKRWLFLMGHVPSHCYSTLDFFNYPHELADFIAGYFLPDYTLKQKLLETLSQEERLCMVEEILTRGVDWFSKNPVEYHLEQGH